MQVPIAHEQLPWPQNAVPGKSVSSSFVNPYGQ
ncbi:Uncharacterised protein [Mycobacteroides abscessus subsp. abscessus]|nr:Uncharacterised protein [Mycobacteroides abscessus subsp. abscessus]